MKPVTQHPETDANTQAAGKGPRTVQGEPGKGAPQLEQLGK